MYRFDEVQFYMPDGQTATAEEIEASFTAWWEYGLAWPPAPTPEEEPLTRKELTEVVTKQKEQIAMLEECIMEVSEEVYK